MDNNTYKMKTLLILSSKLGRDGTSRFITYLANDLADRNSFRVKLLFFRKVDKELLCHINKKVEIHSLEIRKCLWLSSFRIILNIINIRPNYCLIGFHQLLWMGFLRSLMHVFGIKLYFRETIIPTLFHKDDSILKRIVNKKAYQQFDRIIVQSIDMRDDLINHWGCRLSHMTLINNPVDIEYVRSNVGQCPDELKNKKQFTFVTAGRLTHQKGYDIIIERMAELKERLNFQLYILGSGELEDELKSLIKYKGLENNVKLLGYKTNVFSYLKYADALLLCSRYEGFPNIVLEANALGIPVFSNRCLGGINEIIYNGINGIVCNFENFDDFQKGQLMFMATKFDNCQIVEVTKKRYDISIIMSKYIQEFN